jgi:hypothetical protein
VLKEHERGKEEKKFFLIFFLRGGLPKKIYGLLIPVVRQGVDCFYSVGLGCSWTSTVIIFNDQRGFTLFVSMIISVA